MGENEDLKKEIEELKSKKEVDESFKKRDIERKELKKQKFLLKHRKGIGFAKKVGSSVGSAGKEVFGGLKHFGQNIAEKQRREPIQEGLKNLFSADFDGRSRGRSSFGMGGGNFAPNMDFKLPSYDFGGAPRAARSPRPKKQKKTSRKTSKRKKRR